MSEIVGPGSKYSDDDRRRVVLEYAIYGSLTKVSQTTGIPRQTLSHWTRTDWWDPLLSEVQREKELIITSQHTEIAIQAGEVVKDRLANGDVRLVDGKQVRVPISGRDAAWIGAVSTDKHQLLRNKPTSITAKSSYEAALEGLADFLRQVAREEKVVSEQ